MTPLSGLNGVLTSVVKTSPVSSDGGIVQEDSRGKHVTSKRDQRRFLAADGALSMLLMGHLRRYLVCLCTSVWLNALVYMQCWDHLSIQTPQNKRGAGKM